MEWTKHGLIHEVDDENQFICADHLLLLAQQSNEVGFEVFTTLTVKSDLVWNVMQFSPGSLTFLQKIG
jgi:hypothetical protein